MSSIVDEVRGNRILIEAELKAYPTERFQPTGFPGLGAATYESPRGKRMILVESAQSMANRLEMVIWNEALNDVIEPLKGMPFVRTTFGDTKFSTNTILEAHRLASSYVTGDTKFRESLLNEMIPSIPGGKRKNVPISIPTLAQVVYKYDPGSVLHGVFLPDLDGRFRLPRLLSSFIEAEDVKEVESGGVKNDRVNQGGDTSMGQGNVPYARTEYVAGKIVAYFAFDLVQLKAYHLPAAAEEFLLTLGLYKVRKFLDSGLRLRTACEFDVVGTPQGLEELPSFPALEEHLKDLIIQNTEQGIFASPAVTQVNVPLPDSKKSKDENK